MRLCIAILLPPAVVIARQSPPSPWLLASSGTYDLKQALCEQYAEAILNDGPNAENPHQQCQQHIHYLIVSSPKASTEAALSTSDLQDICKSLGAGLVALHLSGGILRGNAKRNAEACASLVSPQSVSFHANKAPEPGRIKEFGEPVADTSASKNTSRSVPVPAKLDEFGKGGRATTTSTTTISTTPATVKRFRRGAATLPDAYEPRYKKPSERTNEAGAGFDDAAVSASSSRISGQAKDEVVKTGGTSTTSSDAASDGAGSSDSTAAQGNATAAGGNAGSKSNVTVASQRKLSGSHHVEKPDHLTNVDTNAACAHCAAANKGKESAAQPDMTHGPEVRSPAMKDTVDVTTNGGRARMLAKGEVTLDSCRRTVRTVLKLIGHGVLKKDDLGGNLAPICERQARGEFTRILLPGDYLNRADERALEELCFKLDGRLTMAIEAGELLPRPTPIGIRAKGTPESFCEGFGKSVYPKKQLRKLPELPDGTEGIPTVPPTLPPDPLEAAVQWATGLSGFHLACVNFLHEFQANVSDTIELTSGRYDSPEGGGGIEISHAFPWSSDFKGFKTCEEEMSNAQENRSEAIPGSFQGKDWPKRLCLDIALGYMSARSAHVEDSAGLVAEAQALTLLARATPDTFCRIYEAQFGQQAPPGAAGDKGQMPSEPASQEGGLSGQMSGNENPPQTPKLTRSTSANHAEQKQRGTETKTHWMTGSMPGPNHDIKS